MWPAVHAASQPARPFMQQSNCSCSPPVETSAFSPPRLCLSHFLYQISISFKSYSSFQVDIGHLLPEASLAFLALLDKAQLFLFRAPPLVLVVVTPRLSLLCVNWFCQHRVTRQGAPPLLQPSCPSSSCPHRAQHPCTVGAQDPVC